MVLGSGDLLGGLDSSVRGEARTNLIRSILPGFIERNISASQALEDFRSVGLGIRRQEFLNIYREILGKEKQANRIRFVSFENTPSESILDQSSIAFSGKYRFIYEVTTFNSEKNREEKVHFGYDFDTLTTLGEMNEEVKDAIIEQSPRLRDFIESMRVIKGFISA